MTPFELSLENELNIEWQRFANDWLFRWYGMTYEGGKTDVEDFRGGRIRYAGIRFGEQQQQIYWQTIDRYLRLKVHETFQRWDTETSGYSDNIRLASIDGVERNLQQFVAKILQQSLDTDRRLRGMGSIIPTASGSGTGAGVEIIRLGQAHRSLLEGKLKNELTHVPVSKRLEAFYANNKGLIWFLGVVLAAVSLAWSFLHR